MTGLDRVLRRTGERRAVALLVLGFYTSVFSLVALVGGTEWTRCFAALALCYGVGFFALAAGYFWARWYGAGLALSGTLTAALGSLTAGPSTGLLVWGGLHGTILAMLAGQAMAQVYEGQAAWRERWRLDDEGVDRIRKAVIRGAASLPSLITFSLAPRAGEGLWASAGGLAGGLALGLAALGLVALLRGRSVGILALGGAAVAALVAAVGALLVPSSLLLATPGPDALTPATLAACLLGAAALLGGAALPLAGPTLRYLRGRA